MPDFVHDTGQLPAHLREAAARHCEITYNLVFGGVERVKANYFRCREHPGGCPSEKPEAVALRALIDQLRTRNPLRVRCDGFDRAVRPTFSELLRQSHARSARDGDVMELQVALEHLWKDFDRQMRVPADDLDRAQLIAEPHLRREAERSAAEARERDRQQRAAREKADQVRQARLRVLTDEPDEPLREFFPARGA